MTEEDRVKQVMFRFEDGGLVSKSVEKVLSCVSDSVLGIGLGEQGIVRDKEEIKKVLEEGVRTDTPATYSLAYKNVNVHIHRGQFAVACGEVTVVSENGDTVTRSTFQQSLSLLLEDGEWKICGLHASTPVITEESLEAYPLKIAEKMLQSMREKIGEAAYQAEEQYRQAVLADTVAFYIINFTTDILEKCQLNNDWCVYAEPGTRYEEFALRKAPEYIVGDVKDTFFDKMSVKAVREAFAAGQREVSIEYRHKCPDEKVVWLLTVIRLIQDAVTGDLKGIMYVKNIDESKRQEIDMRNRAEYDEMTMVLNKSAFAQKLQDCSKYAGSLFMMLDVDNFKSINDTYGHPLGDKVLIAVAAALRESFGGCGCVGRVGGDEFAVFFKDGEDQQNKLEEILEALRRIYLLEAPKLCITCSIGVARCGETSSFEELYQRADQALYLSKNKGKNQISFDNA